MYLNNSIQMKKKTDKAKTPMPDDNQPSPIILWLITVSMLMIVAATLMPIILPGNTVFRYVYAIGAAVLLVSRIFAPYRGNVLRVKRLYRIEFWSSIFFCAAVFFLFYDDAQKTDWLAFTLAGGALQIYTSIMIPRAIAKANREDKA